MVFKTSGIQWTDLELRGLLEDEDSCVYLERVQKHLGLHPFHLTNLNEALREILNTNLNSYDPELNGLLLSYKNIKILSPLGDILHDTCFIHIDIEADFYIFKPAVGRNLKGFVNKKGTNHIGILLHKAFNVSIPKLNENQEDWPGDKVKVGQEVKFTPDEIDFKTRLPYIRGSIYEEEYLNGCQLFNEQIAATSESEFYKITRWSINDKSTNLKNQILKQENKRIIFYDDYDVDIDLNCESEKKSVKKVKMQTNDIQEPITKTSKKRKRKSRFESISELKNTIGNEYNVKIEEINKSTPINSVNEFMDNNFIDTKNNEISIKKSKKRRKKLEDSSENNENEIKFKIKNLIENDELDNKIKIKTESKTLSKNKKRKRKSDEITQMDDTEDEKNHKKCLKNFIKHLKFDQSAYEELERLKKKSKKIKQPIIDDYTFMDTEDEKQYKSTLKSLITTVQNDTLENDFEFITPKQIKIKKKQKSSKLDIEFKLDPQLIKIEQESVNSEHEHVFKKFKMTDSDVDSVSNGIFNKAENEHLERKHKKSHKSTKLKKEEIE